MSKKYTIQETEPQMVSEPALAKKIDKARQDYAEGRYTECKTPEELTAFLEALC